MVEVRLTWFSWKWTQEMSCLLSSLQEGTRKEVAKQLRKIRQTQVVRPSRSPWSSPVVLMRKDSSHRFCVDYQGLNAVTKGDSFPLPCIDDLLDDSRCFSTLDLASDFWQIPVHKKSQKTAFSTSFELFEFRLGLRMLLVHSINLCSKSWLV